MKDTQGLRRDRKKGIEVCDISDYGPIIKTESIEILFKLVRVGKNADTWHSYWTPSNRTDAIHAASGRAGTYKTYRKGKLATSPIPRTYGIFAYETYEAAMDEYDRLSNGESTIIELIVPIGSKCSRNFLAEAVRVSQAIPTGGIGSALRIA
jgi:hypothetical protein